MTSFNHYALGAVADWLHRTVAGLAPAAPGYRRIEIRPVLGGGLTAAAARHRTPYGLAASSWQIEAGQLTLDVEIPANCAATVHLPGTEDEPLEVGSGRYRWSYPYEAPAVVYPPLTIDSTLGDLIDQPAVYAQVMHLVAQHNPEFADRMDGQVSVSLRQAIHMNPSAQELQAKVEAVLAKSGTG
jgi:alpha-L-rhamnosidase